MKLTNKRYEEIKEIIVEIFETVGLSDFPIEGKDIAVKLGINLIPYCKTKDEKRLIELNENGLCGFENGKVYIWFNDKKCKGRINFTVLHELGHLILGHTEQCSLAESEADFFAKYAIAPPVLIEMLNIKSKNELKNYFVVSNEESKYAWIYYLKWKKINNYKDYEYKLLNLFKK